MMTNVHFFPKHLCKINIFLIYFLGSLNDNFWLRNKTYEFNNKFDSFSGEALVMNKNQNG
jgi:hypothetical protein